MSDTPSKHLLLIEDDLEIRSTIQDLLQEEGYTVETAAHGAHALELLRSDRPLPALILLDVSMPVMDGNAFRVEQLKSPQLAEIPTVMITAGGQKQNKDAKEDRIEYLRKPINLGELLELVQSFCGTP